MIRYLEDKYQPEQGTTSLAVEVTKTGVVRTIRLSSNTGKVLKVIATYHGEDAHRQAVWVFAGKYGY